MYKRKNSFLIRTILVFLAVFISSIGCVQQDENTITNDSSISTSPVLSTTQVTITKIPNSLQTNTFLDPSIYSKDDDSIPSQIDHYVRPTKEPNPIYSEHIPSNDSDHNTWKPCLSRLWCTSILAPVDATNHSLGYFNLHFAIRPTKNVQLRKGLLIIHPGGPGASGIDFLDNLGSLSWLNESYDIVSWDQRGVSDTAIISCVDNGPVDPILQFRQTNPVPESEEELRILNQSAKNIIDRCKPNDSIPYALYKTENTVDDVDAIRQALQENELTFFGFSYGTRVGLQYAKTYPSHTQSLILDGVFPPNKSFTSYLSEQASGMQQTINTMLETCASLSPCPVENPQQVFIDLVHDDSHSAIALYAAVTATYNPQASGKQFITALAESTKGNTHALLQIAQQYWQAASTLSYLATTCADFMHPETAESFQKFTLVIQEKAPDIGSVIANELLPCAFWPDQPKTEFNEDWYTSINTPTLVIGNEGDVATPLTDAKLVEKKLPQAQLIIHGTDGHTISSRSICVQKIIKDFLLSPDLLQNDANTIFCRWKSN